MLKRFGELHRELFPEEDQEEEEEEEKEKINNLEISEAITSVFDVYDDGYLRRWINWEHRKKINAEKEESLKKRANQQFIVDTINIKLLEEGFIEKSDSKVSSNKVTCIYPDEFDL